MKPGHASRVRLALVAVLAGLLALAGLSEVRSQPPGFGGRPPGNVTGTPGGISGMPRPGSGISGMPSMPRPGISGGISGNPGMPGSGISGTPGRGISGSSFPPTPTGVSGISGMGHIPSMDVRAPSIPVYETVWKCTRCQAEVGRGPARPSLIQCPSCGARIGGSGFTSTRSAGSTGGPSGSSDSPVDSKSLVTIIGVVVGVAFLAGLVAFIVKMARGTGRPPKRAKRRRRVSLDDL
jgi:hypothetical protein